MERAPFAAKIKKNVIYFTSIALVLCLCIMDVFSLSSMLPEQPINASEKLPEIYTNDLSVDNIPEDISLNIGFNKSDATKIESTDDDNPNIFTVVNDDGTKSLYSFQQPVKFNISDNSSSNSQLFRIISNNDGTCRIMSAFYNLRGDEVVDVAGSYLDPGAKIVQNPYNGDDKQKWVIEKADKGDFYLDAITYDNSSFDDWIVHHRQVLES